MIHRNVCFRGAAARRRRHGRRREKQNKKEDFHPFESNTCRDKGVLNTRCRSDIASRRASTVNPLVDLPGLHHHPTGNAKRSATFISQMTDQTVLASNRSCLTNKVSTVSVKNVRRMPAKGTNEIDFVNVETEQQPSNQPNSSENRMPFIDRSITASVRSPGETPLKSSIKNNSVTFTAPSSNYKSNTISAVKVIKLPRAVSLLEQPVNRKS